MSIGSLQAASSTREAITDEMLGQGASAKLPEMIPSHPSPVRKSHSDLQFGDCTVKLAWKQKSQDSNLDFAVDCWLDHRASPQGTPFMGAL